MTALLHSQGLRIAAAGAAAAGFCYATRATTETIVSAAAVATEPWSADKGLPYSSSGT
eukprot:CAMPEP_0181205302 /NCGR_PEP_ID=MMETSP1096-20121128/20401_1 /TAXON_ID=156174 ORGANISM="Chrysochromulina ericina, Strain CCMP281" /NCGR_SAMPLE_ID=MMETSP1096 /ASSEMBLY_ACC=CAM_ASM_000453 /LENGTH=57 /DNA_ID=CAMNT_0023296069 /DNA_START=50 /DNA_END=220 /DNA_ORIENTATION=+